MNWKHLRRFPWLDTRARFVAAAPPRAKLLDLGSSDGETLNHIAELRPDLRLCSADKFGRPENYPRGCNFQRCDFVADRLPWPDNSMDAITCMHVVEHLESTENLMQETNRLLKPGGRIYLETPHPKTVQLPSAKGRFTLNFFDDPTHVRIVRVADLTAALAATSLVVEDHGISRNWLFAASHLIYCWRAESRKKFTARVHWIGWSAYLVARKPH